MTRAAVRIRKADAQTGDVLLVWDAGPLAGLIEFEEKAAGEGDDPPSHAALVAPRGRILEAVWPRVKLSPANTYATIRTEYWALNGMDAFTKALAYQRTQNKYLGDGYDFAGLVGMAGVEAARMLNRLSAKIGIDIHVADWLANRRRIWCSEMVGFELSLLYHGDAPDYRALDPAGLRLWLTGATPPKVARA